jgi:carboxyl-terminal processing protease
MIVDTRGRTRGSNRPYASSKINTDHHYPIVILINPSSASASEIVAGAVQDHDRGLIVGDTSFGKGLVQSVYPLSKNAGLALTTQKWHTPSGRLIQRDYSQISQFDYYNHRDGITSDTPKKEDIHRSDLGRAVYGGGGITPDYVVKDQKVNEFQDTMGKRFAFYTFVQEYLTSNPKIDNTFEVSDLILEAFKKHLTKRGIDFTTADFDANRDYLKRLIKYEVFYNRLGVSDAQRVLLEGDPQVLKAIALMPDAKDLASRARRQLAERREQ